MTVGQLLKIIDSLDVNRNTEVILRVPVGARFEVPYHGIKSCYLDSDGDLVLLDAEVIEMVDGRILR